MTDIVCGGPCGVWDAQVVFVLAVASVLLVALVTSRNRRR